MASAEYLVREEGGKENDSGRKYFHVTFSQNSNTAIVSKATQVYVHMQNM